MPGGNASPLTRYLPIPKDENAERDVIAGMCTNPNLLIQGCELERELFTDPRQDIWEVVRDLGADGRPVTWSHLRSGLHDKRGVASGTVEDAYLSDLYTAFLTEREFTAQVARLRAVRNHRDFARYVSEAAAGIEDDGATFDHELERLQSRIISLATSGVSDQEPEQIVSILTRALDDIEGRMKGEVQAGLSTGFPELDNYFRFEPGDMVLVAARPAVGKTAFSLSLSALIADEGNNVAFFSQEMRDQSMAKRLLAGYTQIDSRRISMGKGLSPAEFQRLLDCAHKDLSDFPLWLDDTAALTIPTFRNKMRKLTFAKKKPALGVVDYIQLMRGTEKDRQHELQNISGAVKQTAMEMGIPILALSQLNRNVEGRTNKRPTLSDLRESGALEQDSDIVLALYRDEMHDPHTCDTGIMEVIVLKNRNGPCGTVKLGYKAETTTVYSLGG